MSNHKLRETMHVHEYRNGLWFKDELDSVEYKFKGEYEDLRNIFRSRDLEDYNIEVERGGNNPFGKTSCLQFNVFKDFDKKEMYNSFVEVQVYENKINVYKVLDNEDFKTTSELLDTVSKLEKLYKPIIELIELGLNDLEKENENE